MAASSSLADLLGQAKIDDGEAKAAVLRRLHADRWLAHQVMFAHRHPEASGECHQAIVADIYRPQARGVIEGFRGIGKSTLLEEAAVLRAGFREFHNMVVLGASYSRACDRLAAIKRELEGPVAQMVFGPLRGAIWQEGKIVLANAVCIQALGRDQSMLGIKHGDWRPDAALVDDVEDPEEVRTDDDRRKTWDWFLKTFLPSLDHPLYSWVRVLGTRRGVGSLPERLEADGWQTAKYPIEHPAPESGDRVATWPAKFPLPVIDQMRVSYRGDMHTWSQEYMCEPVSAADRVFTESMIRVEERAPSWHAVYAMIDPARTTNRNSATTGWAVWSWLGPKLIVWAAGAEMLKPDEIIELIFTIAEAYDPVWLGFEEDGLNEWAKQPIRTEMAKRHHSIPFKPVRAPRGKTSFIGALQTHFAAGEVIFAQPLPELRDQLLSFPTGKIDAPNALAYALTMRPASPIYDNFSADHIQQGLEPIPGKPLYLAANATRAMTTAALVQFADDGLFVYADWVEEGPPDEVVGRIYAEAGALYDTARPVELRPGGTDWRDHLQAPARQFGMARQPLRWVVPPLHKDQWNNVGLLQAIARLPATAAAGADPGAGRVALGDRLNRLARGQPAVVVSDTARWTLRALAGGHSRMVDRRGGVGEVAEEGPYRWLMEGIESFCGLLARAQPQDVDGQSGNYAVNSRGQRYESAMPNR